MQESPSAGTTQFKAQYTAEPAPFIEAGFLTGDFGREAVRQLDVVIREIFNDNPFLTGRIKYDAEAEVMTGSSTLLVPLVNHLEIIQNAGLEVATPADTEYMVRNGDQLKILSNHYVDTGVIWRSVNEPNSYLANYLWKHKLSTSLGEAPILFPLANLQLEADPDSPYGVVFNSTEGRIFYGLKTLNTGGSFKSEDVGKETGIPTKVGEGTRTLYTINSGLSRLSLYWDLDLFAGHEGLANSYGDGRVVVVRRKKAAASGAQNTGLEGRLEKKQ